MTASMMPELSDSDPEIAGEGSLDPLGLSALADRLAEQLVPDVRARMSRPRLLLLSSDGAGVTGAHLPRFAEGAGHAGRSAPRD